MSMTLTARHWIHEHPGLPEWWHRGAASVRRVFADDRVWIILLALAALAFIVWLSHMVGTQEIPAEWIEPLPGMPRYYPV